MVKVIPSDHVDEVPVVEPNQHDDVLVVPEPVLVDEDEDPEGDEFEEEEDPQEEEDDMEIDIKEDENDMELTYPYKEVDPLNPPPPISESEPDDEIEVENPIEHEDETVPASVHKVGRDINSLFGLMASILRRLCGCEMAHALVEKKGKAKDKFYGKLILELGNEVRLSVEKGTTTMEKLVEKLGNTEDKTRVQAHEFYQEMIHKRFVFEERPNEAINVPIEDEKSPSFESRESPRDPKIMPPKSVPITQAAIRQMIMDSVDVAIVAEWARQANVRNNDSGSGPARGQDAAPAVHEYTFAGFMKCNPAVFYGVEEAVKLQRWFEKTKSVFEIGECAKGKKVKEYDVVAYTQRFNELALMCPRMVEPERVKVDAYIRGLKDNIKGEVTSSKPVCTIKCHKCGKVGHKARYCKEKSVAMGANAQPIWTCYDYGEQAHTRNRCPKKVKQDEVGEARGRAYAIKDAEPQGSNVVAGTFLLNNCHAFVLFDSGSDRSFMDTRF
nr:reverse transcriptase domain-containing protein [Tanacetum cinerariifolium]